MLAEFRLSGTEELKRWVLGFGAKAAVLEPESLRLEIAEELQALLTAYLVAGNEIGRQATRTVGLGIAVGRTTSSTPTAADPTTFPWTLESIACQRSTLPLGSRERRSPWTTATPCSRPSAGSSPPSTATAGSGSTRSGACRLQPRRLTLVPQSRLRLRLPSEEVATYLALAGTDLDLDGDRLSVGIPRVEPLRPRGRR